MKNTRCKAQNDPSKKIFHVLSKRYAPQKTTTVPPPFLPDKVSVVLDTSEKPKPSLCLPGRCIS